MPDSTYVDPIIINGDMLANLSAQPYQQGNPGDADLGIIMPGVEAFGAPTDLYRLVWTLNSNTIETEFGNGQGWALQSYTAALDPDGNPRTGDEGWTTIPGMEFMTPKDDLATGLGDGDEYIVFEFGGQHILYDINGGLPTTPTDITILATQENGDLAFGDNDGSLDFYDAYAATVCFSSGTLISTDQGPRRIETLDIGDTVMTKDNGSQPILWHGLRHLSRAELKQHPHLRPVRIKAGALGDHAPSSDLRVSPQHRMLVSSKVAQNLTGSRDVLVPAIKLTHMRGISQTRAPDGISYHHLLLPRHEVIYANHAPAESLLPAQQALRSLDEKGREEIAFLFPEVRSAIPGRVLRTARPVLTGSSAVKTVRNLKNKLGRKPQMRSSQPRTRPACV